VQPVAAFTTPEFQKGMWFGKIVSKTALLGYSSRLGDVMFCLHKGANVTVGFGSAWLARR